MVACRTKEVRKVEVGTSTDMGVLWAREESKVGKLLKMNCN